METDAKKLKLEEFIEYEQPSKYIVESQLYDKNGKTPVLTAGQTFILGYTNEKNGIYNDLPVIIFDDFTTSVQYVDMPFKVKSSAIKMLKNKQDADIKYCYYLLKHKQEQPVNHKRQWISTYSQYYHNLPDIVTQKQIVEEIDKVNYLKIQQYKLLQSMDLLVQTKFNEMFGDRMLNNKYWPIKTLEKAAKFYNGKAHEKVVDENGEYILITSRCIASDVSDYRKTNESLFPLFENDICMVMSDVPNGKALGKCLLVKNNNKFTLNQRICCLRDYNMNPVFFYHLLNRHEHFLSFDNGDSQTNLRKNDVLSCPIICPPLEFQEEFEKYVTKVEKIKQEIKQSINKTEELLNSLMNRYFD